MKGRSIHIPERQPKPAPVSLQLDPGGPLLRAQVQAADLPVAVLGMILIFAVSRAVCCRKGNAVAVAALLLPLAACLVVTDTVPKEENLFGLLLCL